MLDWTELGCVLPAPWARRWGKESPAPLSHRGVSQWYKGGAGNAYGPFPDCTAEVQSSRPRRTSSLISSRHGLKPNAIRSHLRRTVTFMLNYLQNTLSKLLKVWQEMLTAVVRSWTARSNATAKLCSARLLAKSPMVQLATKCKTMGDNRCLLDKILRKHSLGVTSIMPLAIRTPWRACTEGFWFEKDEARCLGQNFDYHLTHRWHSGRPS